MPICSEKKNNQSAQEKKKKKKLHNLHFLQVFMDESNLITVMIQSFRTDTPGQTVQTQIRLLLEEQSDQGLHCLPFRLHRLDSLFYGRAT